MAVLIDSSLWVHQLRRRGDRAKREQVEAWLRTGVACWCPPVRLELWRGVAGEVERRALQHYDEVLPSHPVTDDVWERAVRLAGRGREGGITVPLADLLVFACARVHGLELAHDDAHFLQLEQLDAHPDGG